MQYFIIASMYIDRRELNETEKRLENSPSSLSFVYRTREMRRNREFLVQWY